MKFNSASSFASRRLSVFAVGGSVLPDVSCARLASAVAPASHPGKGDWLVTRTSVSISRWLSVLLVACDSANQALTCPWALACHSPAIFAIPRFFAVVLLK